MIEAPVGTLLIEQDVSPDIGTAEQPGTTSPFTVNLIVPVGAGVTVGARTVAVNTVRAPLKPPPGSSSIGAFATRGIDAVKEPPLPVYDSCSEALTSWDTGADNDTSRPQDWPGCSVKPTEHEFWPASAASSKFAGAEMFDRVIGWLPVFSMVLV